ncbi:hypothetical protein ONE63_009784 [Megalurothrips usitatus]|uniref:RNA-binding protein 48 n=1 Tax=Megalurothrips usitatus TaxID=439358 RepID=A0AAV7XMA8_9NEOP|nr:hypothetical protein ONE63_009784 [Megalurothrips usitatus]
MESRRREVKKLPHHEQESLCTTRAAYRQGRQLTAVKVYTVNDESQHLIISGVPSLGLQDELRRLCTRFGDIKSLVYVPNYTTEKFVEGYHVQYARIQSARFAKRQIDGRAFFGGSLHVCYAPEMESVSETRNKLLQRRHDIAKRCMHDGTHPGPSTSNSSFSNSCAQVVPGNGAYYVSNPREEICIWNGKETNCDPRLLAPAEELEKVSGEVLCRLLNFQKRILNVSLLQVSSTLYGPQPNSYWKDGGAIKRTSSSMSSKKGLPKKVSTQTRPLLANSLNVTPPITPKPECKQVSRKLVAPILRLVPSQVKGAQKKIVFHPKHR